MAGAHPSRTAPLHGKPRTGALQSPVRAYPRLVELAELNDSSQAACVTRFLVRTFNGAAFPFDLFELGAPDVAIADDALRWGKADPHRLRLDGERRVAAVGAAGVGQRSDRNPACTCLLWVWSAVSRLWKYPPPTAHQGTSPGQYLAREAALAGPDLPGQLLSKKLQDFGRNLSGDEANDA